MDKVQKYYDILIIGGGAAGMAAALAAEKAGFERILIAERKERFGGVLDQCVHNGFGLGYFKEDLTGIQYSERFIDLINNSHVDIQLNCMVLKINPDRTALLAGPDGFTTISFDRCILATGCRERSIYSQAISGTRPSGIMTCGTAQKLINIDRLDIGDDIVILGTGDVGQIMARQLVQAGKNVIAMIEKEPVMGGLKRNQENCIRAYNIPVMLNSEITEIQGIGRISGVVVRHNDTGNSELISCSTLLTAIGMIPEKELAADLIKEGQLPEWLTCVGNCDYVHDIVDSVTQQALNIFTLH